MERHEASAADLHQDKYIEDPKAHPYRDAEAAGHHRLGMITDKGPPALGGKCLASATLWFLRQILPGRTRRDLNPELDKEFGGYSILAPGGIISCQAPVELTQIFGYPGSADRSGFPRG